MKLSDQQVVLVLDRAIAGIDPVIDVLAERDPFGIKNHTFHSVDGDDGIGLVKHAASVPLDRAAWPGTRQWQQRTLDQRAAWWIDRIGAVNTIAVATPGIFGFWARLLPAGPLLGFANQAMVLIAIAREYGVDDRRHQIELLAAVLCGRDLTVDGIDHPTLRPLPTDRRDRNREIIKAVWHTARILGGLSGELSRRPQPPRLLRWIGHIPVVGGPVNYLGEWIALRQATEAERAWLADHPEAVDTADHTR